MFPLSHTVHTSDHRGVHEVMVMVEEEIDAEKRLVYTLTHSTYQGRTREDEMFLRNISHDKVRQEGIRAYARGVMHAEVRHAV